MKDLKERICKHEENSYRLTKEYMDTEEFEYFLGGMNDRMAYCPPENKLVYNGSWIMVIQPIPTKVKPVVWGIYWATPCNESINFDGFDKYGRYKVEIMVTDEQQNIHTVGLFPHEYIRLDEVLFQELLDTNGYILNNLGFSPRKTPINLELIEKGRSLTEDERAIIWSLQLDGLTEHQACEEYFYSRHRPEENPTIWYCPTDEFAEFMENQFGWVREIGLPL